MHGKVVTHTARGTWAWCQGLFFGHVERLSLVSGPRVMAYRRTGRGRLEGVAVAPTRGPQPGKGDSRAPAGATAEAPGLGDPRFPGKTRRGGPLGRARAGGRERLPSAALCPASPGA